MGGRGPGGHSLQPGADKALDPNGIGSMLKTKINVNLGTSRDCMDLDTEVEKVNRAVAMGAEAIMDLSSFGDTRVFRRRLTAECPAIIGTVPIYDAVVYYHKALKEITTEEWLDIVRMHAEDGVDFMTIHCGINRSTAKRFKENKRLTEYRFPGRLHYLCLDGDDGEGKPVL